MDALQLQVDKLKEASGIPITKTAAQNARKASLTPGVNAVATGGQNPLAGGQNPLAGKKAVSYTHLTLPTILLV